jgi:hypothetical protein
MGIVSIVGSLAPARGTKLEGRYPNREIDAMTLGTGDELISVVRDKGVVARD